MATGTFDPFDIDTEGLSDRALAIYEYLVGLFVEQAAIQTGKQPRRTVLPTLAAMRRMAVEIESHFESMGGDYEVALDASGPLGHARWEMRLPAGWQSVYQISTARLLGQRVLRETHAKRKSASGKRERSQWWTTQIDHAARKLARPDQPEESLTRFQERVYEYLTDAVENGEFDTANALVDRAPSRSVVNARLRELGYRRGAYPRNR